MLFKKKTLIPYFLVFYLIGCHTKDSNKVINSWVLIKNSDPNKDSIVNDYYKDSSLIIINEKISFNKDSLDDILSTENCIDDSIIWKFFKINELQFSLVESKEFIFKGEKLCLNKIMVDEGEFNEDEANTFIYNKKYGVLIKTINLGFRKFEIYRLSNNDEFDLFTKSIITDSSFFYLYPPPPPKN